MQSLPPPIVAVPAKAGSVPTEFRSPTISVGMSAGVPLPVNNPTSFLLPPLAEIVLPVTQIESFPAPMFATLLDPMAKLSSPTICTSAVVVAKALPSALKLLQDTVMSVFPYWRLIFGAVLAFIVIFAPGGLMGLLSRRRPAEVPGA